MPGVALLGPGISLRWVGEQSQVEPAENRQGDLFALARREAALSYISEHLEATGLRPLLLKGWAVAQYYSSPEARGMGDIDLCAEPGLFEATLTTLEKLSGSPSPPRWEIEDRTNIVLISAGARHLKVVIDLHRDLGKFRLDIDEAFSRARPALIDGKRAILVPCPEHHLRICALHFLGDGGARRRSLEDVAAIAKAKEGDLDWELALGENPLVRGWVLCTVRLAERMVAPELRDIVPNALRNIVIPDWFIDTAETECRKPWSASMPRPRLSQTFRSNPLRLPDEIAARWPNPIRASVDLNRAFDNAPRFPIQVTHFLRGAAHYVSRRLRR
ncbi:nucleotidyltransferase family protein [Limibaculum sp. M0105]|uniref:Nucleotidyltransferase family protein n=1 Tax=Thermohalobaculum xanthum TaxID=2753746 RepID=A0A8J7M6Z4_9RHOB|nr:nucleotidyltransferase family protein [Thermohalobaculum xanthum]